ncbi:metal-dependent hydrolase [Legionella massiliensis]|uniref:Metal-dependent hydrolase n=1 Tax=Legionella massiliensis TaxID=1034943 RepID=A0A078KZG1_9GAMM|nr:MBL fold metallo-hydrolase [Legionella massiliensis]CDZ77174.1 metal-dependent hydrolase [Legionella massiliensis]CEE12912.1 metal-dependent hydrolase [Legionella massiliensis]
MKKIISKYGSYLRADFIKSPFSVFGKKAQGARKITISKSANWSKRKFQNPEPLANDSLWTLIKGARGAISSRQYTSPKTPLEFRAQHLADPPVNGLRVTWLGHASTLVEIDGKNILLDPFWGKRASPLKRFGPQRWYKAPLALEQLPFIDAVVISHDHYDHLDYPTIVAMKNWSTQFIVPLGVGAHLTHWGIAEKQIIELDWWQETKIANVTIAATPARHASGRYLFDRDSKLWASFAFIGDTKRVYYSGDTGTMSAAFQEIGNRYGPFDITLMQIGGYDKSWPDWHMFPEQAVEAHRLVKGKMMLPVHWGLLNLAYHGWTEPVERALQAAKQQNIHIVVPKPGQSVEPVSPIPFERWWPELPWNALENKELVQLEESS